MRTSRPVDPDEAPELTTEMLRHARPATETFSAAAIEHHERERRRGKQKAPTKQLISIRLDRDVIAAFRSTGAGWQGRINATLMKHCPPRRRSKPAPTKRAAARR